MEIEIPKIQLVSAGRVIIDDSNPNKMDKSKFEALKKNIEKYGFINPIITNKDYKIADGYHRLKAGKELGMTEVPVIALPIDEVDRRMLRQILNKLKGEHDQDMDNIEFDFIKESGSWDDFTGLLPDMNDFEFEGEEITPEEDGYEVPNEIETDIKVGDVFQLGEHRLMCGDSTDKESVDVLMDGNKADMVFTDPPYGYCYESNHQTKHKMLKNDDKILDFFKSSFDFMKENSCYYVCLGWQKIKEWLILISQYDLKLKNLIVWKKNNWSMGDLKGAYAGQHELILFLHKGRIKLLKVRDRDIWEFDREPPTLHPTMKPIELCSKAITNSSKQDHIVLDLFGGSGSTLIACEQLKRKCYMMELDPSYCQIIINRWEKFTGKKAEQING